MFAPICAEEASDSDAQNLSTTFGKNKASDPSSKS